MYGYLRTYSDELKVKQVRLYRKYYCMLCTILGKEIGLVYRFLTSYDITLFLILFDYLSIDKKEYKITCPMKKKTQKMDISETALQYSLIVCLYWIVHKLNDDYADEKRHGLIKYIINYNKKINVVLGTEQIDSWEKCLIEYYKKERDEKAVFDELLNAIGAAYGTVFKDYVEFSHVRIDKEAMYDLGNNIGKYIYVMDAYDDYFDDKKKGRFNPFFKMIGYKEFENNQKELSARVEFILKIITGNIYQILKENFAVKSDEFQIIENVLGFGIWKKYDMVSKKYGTEKSGTECEK